MIYLRVCIVTSSLSVARYLFTNILNNICNWIDTYNTCHQDCIKGGVRKAEVLCHKVKGVTMFRLYFFLFKFWVWWRRYSTGLQIYVFFFLSSINTFLVSKNTQIFFLSHTLKDVDCFFENEVPFLLVLHF